MAAAAGGGAVASAGAAAAAAGDKAKDVKAGDAAALAGAAPAGAATNFWKVWCSDCEMTFNWNDKPAVPCAVCAHTNANIAGDTFGAKRNAFLALPVEQALAHDAKVPKGWIPQYIRTHTLPLFERFRKVKAGGCTVLSGNSGRMVLLDLCATAESAKALSAELGTQFLRGELMAPAFLELKKSCKSPAAWKHDSYTWVHALAPRVIDVWNVTPNPGAGTGADEVAFSAGSQAYSITQCYYQDLGEYSKEPPQTFNALFDHWKATILRRDISA